MFKVGDKVYAITFREYADSEIIQGLVNEVEDGFILVSNERMYFTEGRCFHTLTEAKNAVISYYKEAIEHRKRMCEQEIEQIKAEYETLVTKVEQSALKFEQDYFKFWANKGH